MQNLSVLKIPNFLFKGVTFLFQLKIASFNTRRKALGKAALVGAKRWVGSVDYTGAQNNLSELILRQEVMKSALT